MAIDKLTLFELHFDGAQFGPATMNTGGREDADETADAMAEEEMPDEVPTTGAEAEEGGTGRVLALVGLSLLLSVGATVLARRLFGGDEQTTVDEFAEESVEVDTESVE